MPDIRYTAIAADLTQTKYTPEEIADKLKLQEAPFTAG